VNVVLADVALVELIQIGRLIRQDNPARAETFVAELYNRCQNLATTARAFPLLPDWEERGIRRRPYGNYLIFYRISDDVVEILHVLHGARDYTGILFPDE
jgi:toxin ParE1/3/4